MIGYLEGIVVAQRGAQAIINVNGIGYKVGCTKETLASLPLGSSAAMWTHLAVREDALDLYGFLHEDELRFFELLTTVSGIGPKSALGILDATTVETLRSAIAGGNASYLTSVSGIGKKTAEKIVLELKDKVGLVAESSNAALKGDREALEALRALGYSAQEARETLRKVPSEISGSSARLREALRLLGSAL